MFRAIGIPISNLRSQFSERLRYLRDDPTSEKCCNPEIQEELTATGHQGKKMNVQAMTLEIVSYVNTSFCANTCCGIVNT